MHGRVGHHHRIGCLCPLWGRAGRCSFRDWWSAWALSCKVSSFATNETVGRSPKVGCSPWGRWALSRWIGTFSSALWAWPFWFPFSSWLHLAFSMTRRNWVLLSRTARWCIRRQGNHRIVSTSCTKVCKLTSSVKVGSIGFLQGTVEVTRVFIVLVVAILSLLSSLSIPWGIIVAFSSVLIVGLLRVFILIGIVLLKGVHVIKLVGLLSVVGLMSSRPTLMKFRRSGVCSPSHIASAFIVLAKQVVQGFFHLVLFQAGAMSLNHLPLLVGQTWSPKQKPSTDAIWDSDLVLLQLPACFSMISAVLQQALVTTASRSIEELLQGSWHLNSIIIFEASVQLG